MDSGGNLTAALAAFQAVLTASTHPYFANIVWTSDGTHIIGTALTAGVPFTFSGSATGGTGTCSNAYTITTASSGPNDVSTAANWSGGAIPANGDTVYIDGSSPFALAHGLSTAYYLTLLRIDMPETALIGLGRIYTSDVAGVTKDANSTPEYRAQSWKFSGSAQAMTVQIGREFGPNVSSGSGRIKLDLNDTSASIQVFNSSATVTSDDTGLPAIQLLANSVYTALFVRSGPAGVGLGVQSETVVVASVTVADTSSASKVTIGPNVTCPTITSNGGVLRVMATSASAAITINGGTAYLEGTTTIATLLCNGGIVYSNGARTITACTIGENATLNTRSSGQAQTITTLTMKPSATLVSASNLTITNAIVFPTQLYQVTVQ